MKTFSTREAAKRAGISWITLRRWLAAGKIRPSQSLPFDGRTLWRWTPSDVEKLRTFTKDNFGKGKGPKPKGKK